MRWSILKAEESRGLFPGVCLGHGGRRPLILRRLLVIMILILQWNQRARVNRLLRLLRHPQAVNGCDICRQHDTCRMIDSDTLTTCCSRRSKLLSTFSNLIEVHQHVIIVIIIVVGHRRLMLPILFGLMACCPLLLGCSSHQCIGLCRGHQGRVLEVLIMLWMLRYKDYTALLAP